MVKALHPLGPVAPRIKLAPEVRVDVEHAENRSRNSTVSPSAAAADPAAAAKRALESPLNFPPLAQATVPGDHLAITLDEAIPAAIAIVHGTLAAAEQAGFDPEAIAIVTSDEEFAHTLRTEIGNGAGTAPRLVVHDPDDRENLCFVGLLEKNERLLVNRTICEADVVLPIGCARLPGVAGGSIYESLFPRLCDAETLGRLRTPSQRESAAARRRAEKAGRLLGMPLVMQVVPGGDGTVADVVAGDPQSVAEHCQQLCQQLWSLRVARRASLVIASVTGGPQEQRWDNVARALAAIEPLVADGGAVAICSDLDARPGHSLSRLADSSDLADVEHDLRNDHSTDSWPAWQLARALQRGPVYFLSQLDAETVEEIGLAPIADMDELTRLAARHESCIVLDDSQHVVAAVAGES